MTADATLRLNQLVARRAGVGRRTADELIAAGKVRVDGHTVTVPAERFALDCRLSVTGYRVGTELERPLTVLFNKPVEVVTSWNDDEERADLSSFFPERPPSLRYAGRLDYMTSGLLVLSTDGDLINRLTHPRYGAERVYRAWIHGEMNLAQQRIVGKYTQSGERRGETIALKRIGKWGKGERWLLTLHQGENRQIRNAFDAASVKLHRLQRIAHGPYTLGSLQPGQWRPVEG